MQSKLPVIGGVAAALAVAGVLTVIWSNGTQRSTCAPTAHAPVPEAAKKALAGYTGRIMHEVDQSRDGTHDELWSDPMTGSRRQVAFDGQGRIESEFGTTVREGVERTVWVLYPGRTWTSDQHRLPFPLPQVENSAARIAQSYRDNVANGRASILGREVIGGRKTLHLQEIVHLPAPQLPKGTPPLPKGVHFPQRFQNDAWVDPLTYLPVRTSFSASSGGSTAEEAWLPRTPANIAKARLVIPPGFKHMIPERGTGFGFDVVHTDNTPVVTTGTVALHSTC